MNKTLFSLLIISLLYQNFLLAPFGFNLWQKQATETITKEYEDLPEKCTMTIHNTEGSITVKSWPQKKILIEATKTGTDENQKSTQISAKISGSQASIITRVTPDQKSSKVEYTLTVPEDSTVKVTQTLGSVTIKKINGPLDVSITENGSIQIIDSANVVSAITPLGDITVHQKKFDDTASLILKTDRGNITLLLPRETRALLHAKTGSGKIQCDHPVTLAVTSPLNDAAWDRIKKDIEGSLGGVEGGSPITLETAKGSITLKVD